jgi:hypothetical protein
MPEREVRFLAAKYTLRAITTSTLAELHLPVSHKTRLFYYLQTLHRTDPAYLHYMTHLSLISVSTCSVPPDYSQAIQQTSVLREFALKQGDQEMVLLANVQELKLLVDAGRWGDVPAALAITGEMLGFRCLGRETEGENSEVPPKLEEPFRVAMAIYALVLGILYYTQVGAARAAASTLACLHTLLDQGALEKFPDGCVTVSVASSFPFES